MRRLLLPLLACATVAGAQDLAPRTRAQSEAASRCMERQSSVPFVEALPRCYPFTRPTRLRGLWVLSGDESAFLPNANALPRGWTIDEEQTELAAAPDGVARYRGPATRVYPVELIGRVSRAQVGPYPTTVVVDRPLSVRRVGR